MINYDRKLRIYLLLFAVLWGSYNPVMAQKNSMELPISLYSDDGDGFVIIAHRGASAYHPENTMSAFHAAYEMGAEMIELDVTLSKDGVPVVIHDETLDRTTSGKGLVSDFTLEELRGLDAGSWFSEEHAGEPLPTLEDVLEFARDKISLNIEIKPEAVSNEVRGGIEEKAWELVKKYEMEEYVLFSSFNYRAIDHLKEINVDIKAALLYEKQQSAKSSPSQLIDEYSADAFNCSYKQFSRSWAKEAAEKGFPVFVYTVNSERRMKKMIRRGANGIFSDKPDLLKEIVENLWKSNGS
jgi:glycerophosphoryl diester phosphodiesterase